MITKGASVDKYEVLDKIGEGGMATVFKARHTTLGREVAIKVLHPHLASSERNRTRFEREAKAILAVEHPNILKIHDYSGRDAESAWIITELIDGPTLRELLDDVGAMMPEPAAIIGWHLCRALEAAHHHGIVHRDLKPENVMIDGSGEVKLMDFGIARVLTDVQVTMTGALVGSPAYMSPEQATDGEVDARSDLFSLGTVLYRMVTGTLPFRGNNPSVVLKAIIDGTYEDPTSRVPSLDHALAAIICRCLGRDKEDRFASASAVADALAAYLKSVGIDPAAPGPWTVQAYLTDADGYEERLAEALIATLTTRGRAEAEAGDTSAALRTFNRVLSLDEDNTEVVTIIEGMRRPLAAEDKGSTPLALWLAPLLIGLAAVGALAVHTNGFTQWSGEAHVDASLPALPTAPRLSVQRAEVVPEALRVEPASAVEVAVAALAPAPSIREPDDAKRAPDPEPEPTPAPVVTEVEEEPTPEQVAAVEAPCEGSNTLIIGSLGAQKIRIDGGEPEFTPLQRTLTAGTHTVELVADQYSFAQEYAVRVCGNEPAAEPTIDVSYKPSKIVLEGFPPSASVLLNGAQKGTVGDHRSLQLTENKAYSVRVWLDGQTLHESTLTRGFETGQLLPGQTTTITHSP